MLRLEPSLNPDWDLNRHFKLALTCCLDLLRFRFFVPLRQRNSAKRQRDGQEIDLLRKDASERCKGRAGKLCPQDPMGHSFLLQGGVGVGKACLFLSRRSGSSLVWVRWVFKSAEGRSSAFCPWWTESECRPHPIPTQRPEAVLAPPLRKPACLG